MELGRPRGGTGARGVLLGWGGTGAEVGGYGVGGVGWCRREWCGRGTG